MPITQIPFQDPVAPPEKPQPEQLGLYDVRDWETAYRDPDANVPHLLIQLQDDLSRSRKIVLQLNQQVGNVRIGIAIGSLPVAHVVEPKLLRLRLFGRSDWVLEWNLRDRHALG